MQDCENLSRTNGICFDVHVAGLPVGVSEVGLGEVDVRVFLARRTYVDDEPERPPHPHLIDFETDESGKGTHRLGV